MALQETELKQAQAAVKKATAESQQFRKVESPPLPSSLQHSLCALLQRIDELEAQLDSMVSKSSQNADLQSLVKVCSSQLCVWVHCS